MRILPYTLILLAGCHPMEVGPSSDGGSSGDGGPALLSCSAPSGPTWITSKFGILPADQGFDLVGDGKIHNILGALAPFANTYWASLTTDGSAIFLLDLPGLTFPPTDQTNFPLYFFVGIDVDDPPNPSNNLDGTGQFVVPAEQFDVTCLPSAPFESTKLASGVLTASAKQVDIVSLAIGDFRSNDEILRGTFSADGRSITNAVLGGVATPCAMSKISSPIAGSGNSTLLDTIVNAFKIQPDIDRDHNGLDRLIGDGQKVVTCITGDGATIDGHGCTCDPRMHDGYSEAFFFEAVPAQIVGIAH